MATTHTHPIIDWASTARGRQDLWDLQAEVGRLGRAKGLTLDYGDERSKAYRAFWTEIDHHANFPRSSSNERLEPLAIAFIASLEVA